MPNIVTFDSIVFNKSKSKSEIFKASIPYILVHSNSLHLMIDNSKIYLLCLRYPFIFFSDGVFSYMSAEDIAALC